MGCNASTPADEGVPRAPGGHAQQLQQQRLQLQLKQQQLAPPDIAFVGGDEPPRPRQGVAAVRAPLPPFPRRCTPCRPSLGRAGVA